MAKKTEIAESAGDHAKPTDTISQTKCGAVGIKQGTVNRRAARSTKIRASEARELREKSFRHSQAARSMSRSGRAMSGPNFLISPSRR
jgi:hypothetical protein